MALPGATKLAHTHTKKQSIVQGKKDKQKVNTFLGPEEVKLVLVPLSLDVNCCNKSAACPVSYHAELYPKTHLPHQLRMQLVIVGWSACGARHKWE